jgi:hypothetical protein
MLSSENCLIDILSKYCRDKNHSACHGKWRGLGFEVVCRCQCGHKGKGDLKEYQQSS